MCHRKHTEEQHYGKHKKTHMTEPGLKIIIIYIRQLKTLVGDKMLCPEDLEQGCPISRLQSTSRSPRQAGRSGGITQKNK